MPDKKLSEIKKAQDAFYKEFKEELDLQLIYLTNVDGKPTIVAGVRDESTKHLVPEEYKGFPVKSEVTGTIRKQTPTVRTCASTVEENEKRISAQGERTEKGLTHGTHGNEETNPRGISLP